jgi:hypothetical protein
MPGACPRTFDIPVVFTATRGYKRFRSGGWSLVVDAGKDPITGKRRQVHRTFKAPNTKRGGAEAGSALAKLVAEIEAGRALPSSGLTVAQLVERYIVDGGPRWSPGAAAETRRRVNAAPHALRR